MHWFEQHAHLLFSACVYMCLSLCVFEVEQSCSHVKPYTEHLYLSSVTLSSQITDTQHDNNVMLVLLVYQMGSTYAYTDLDYLKSGHGSLSSCCSFLRVVIAHPFTDLTAQRKMMKNKYECVTWKQSYVGMINSGIIPGYLTLYKSLSFYGVTGNIFHAFVEWKHLACWCEILHAAKGISHT